MAQLTKTELARRQLGTALALYLSGSDPVSVHTLAYSGCELAEALAEKAGGPPFRTFTLASDPEMSDGQFTAIRNKYWNAFKHSTTRKGVDRDDSSLLEEFSERENEERLFIGWCDYGTSRAPMPVEAQVYVVWFFGFGLPEIRPGYRSKVLAKSCKGVSPSTSASRRSPETKFAPLYREISEKSARQVRPPG